MKEMHYRCAIHPLSPWGKNRTFIGCIRTVLPLHYNRDKIGAPWQTWTAFSGLQNRCSSTWTNRALIGAAGWNRTTITSLKWNFYVAVSTLVRVDLFKRPTIRRQRHWLASCQGIEPRPRDLESLVLPEHLQPINCLVRDSGFEPLTFSMSLRYSTAEIITHLLPYVNTLRTTTTPKRPGSQMLCIMCLHMMVV